MEAPVPHPLGDALPVGDGSPVGQGLCRRLDEEQEPIVEGRGDGVHLRGQQSLAGWDVEGTQWVLGGGTGSAGSWEGDGRKHPHRTARFCY